MKADRQRLTAIVAMALCLGTPVSTYALDGAALYKKKVCHTCHGETGSDAILPIYPKVSGQNATYLLAQMKDIRDGRRTNGLSAAMRAVVSTVTDEEFEAIADWLADNT
jgi:cytochrome c